MPGVGLVPMIPVFERKKIFHALDLAATVITHIDSLGPGNRAIPLFQEAVFEKANLALYLGEWVKCFL
jgi:hypothetical protein